MSSEMLNYLRVSYFWKQSYWRRYDVLVAFHRALSFLCLFPPWSFSSTFPMLALLAEVLDFSPHLGSLLSYFLLIRLNLPHFFCYLEAGKYNFIDHLSICGCLGKPHRFFFRILVKGRSSVADSLVFPRIFLKDSSLPGPIRPDD